MNISARTKKLIEQIAAPKITLKLAVPTYPALDSVPADEAREKFDQVFDDFLQAAVEWNGPAEQDEEDDEQEEDDPFLDFAEEHDEKPRPVHAVCITTGGGKTERAAAKTARFIHDGKLKPGWSVLYLVPRHELGMHIDDLFRDRGVTARVYRGRRA